MLKLEESVSCYWPATVSIPIDGGKRADHALQIKFCTMGVDQTMQLLAENRDDRELLRKAVVGWKDVQDANGTELPFSPGTLERLLDIPYVLEGFSRAWSDFAYRGRKGN